MPCFRVIAEDGQPEQAPCRARIDRAVLEAAIDDVAAVLGHRRADAGFDQLPDLVDDLGIGRIVVDRRPSRDLDARRRCPARTRARR